MENKEKKSENKIENSENNNNQPLNALVMGGSGGIGHELVHQLIESPDYNKVVLIGRRVSNDLSNVSKISQHVVDFENIEKKSEELFNNIDVVFCTFGTTRAQAENLENYRKIDQGYVVNVATLAKKNNINHFSFVTSVGANKDSYFFYPSLKGETEEMITNLKFNSFSIYRPPFLAGRQHRSALETAFSWLTPVGNFVSGGRYAIDVKDVAHGMLDFALTPKAKNGCGTIIFDGSNTIRSLIKESKS